MAATYRLWLVRRLANFFIRALLRLGLFLPPTYQLLTVAGRKTGRAYSTPVILVQEGGERWLVSPYGEVGWARNARAAGHVTLGRGWRSETVRSEELDPSTAAPVLKLYIARVPITRPYFDVTPESPLEAFAAEAPRHPVFRIAGPAPFTRDDS